VALFALTRGQRFDAFGLATGIGYESTGAYLQSKVALRMLSWAAARRYADNGTSITVHACHPGELSSPALEEAGVTSGNEATRSGLLSPAEAARTGAFLATDRRIDRLGVGPHWWNSRMRREDCEFMSAELESSCGQLLGVCAAITAEADRHSKNLRK